jgi:hypothetical protein
MQANAHRYCMSTPSALRMPCVGLPCLACSVILIKPLSLPPHWHAQPLPRPTVVVCRVTLEQHLQNPSAANLFLCPNPRTQRITALTAVTASANNIQQLRPCCTTVAAPTGPAPPPPPPTPPRPPSPPPAPPAPPCVPRTLSTLQERAALQQAGCVALPECPAQPVGTNSSAGTFKLCLVGPIGNVARPPRDGSPTGALWASADASVRITGVGVVAGWWMDRLKVGGRWGGLKSCKFRWVVQLSMSIWYAVCA